MYTCICKTDDIVDPSGIQQSQRVVRLAQNLNRPAGVLESHRFESLGGLNVWITPIKVKVKWLQFSSKYTNSVLNFGYLELLLLTGHFRGCVNSSGLAFHTDGFTTNFKLIQSTRYQILHQVICRVLCVLFTNIRKWCVVILCPRVFNLN